MKNNPLPRLDVSPEIHDALLKYCRLNLGDVWQDPEGRHRVGCLDASNHRHIRQLMSGRFAQLAIHDPPYNLIAFDTRNISDYISWCRKWITNTVESISENASLYVWLGADQTDGFQPLPGFMIMMREFALKSRSLLTMRNQRGYGTQKNWMALRQELLYYIRGVPTFNIEAEYTDIPKIL